MELAQSKEVQAAAEDRNDLAPVRSRVHLGRPDDRHLCPFSGGCVEAGIRGSGIYDPVAFDDRAVGANKGYFNERSVKVESFGSRMATLLHVKTDYAHRIGAP